MDKNDLTASMSYGSCFDMLKLFFEEDPQVIIQEMEDSRPEQRHYTVVVKNDEKAAEIGAVMNVPIQTGMVYIKALFVESDNDSVDPKNNFGIEILEDIY